MPKPKRKSKAKKPKPPKRTLPLSYNNHTGEIDTNSRVMITREVMLTCDYTRYGFLMELVRIFKEELNLEISERQAFDYKKKVLQKWKDEKEVSDSKAKILKYWWTEYNATTLLDYRIRILREIGKINGHYTLKFDGKIDGIGTLSKDDTERLIQAAEKIDSSIKNES